ncbi:MAG: hypothetical protein NTU43_10005 [Bacteroidetes bacterium]|nr:hypothetical protein [Bacteroidota bacterium]
MKNILAFIILFVVPFGLFAQFGKFKKKAEVETFKDTRLVVVLMQDSAYNASIIAAMDKYWSYTGFEYSYDTAMQKYKKGVAFLLFSKSKGSKIKAKVCSSEEDFNGLVITKKYKRRIVPEDVLALAYCRNHIDTLDWETEMIRGVQLLNNFFNYAIQAKNDGDISDNRMMSKYPTDKGLLLDKTLFVEDKQIEMKGKEDKSILFDAEVEETENENIQKLIKNQDNASLYYYYSKDEKYCNKLVVSTANSELMYFNSTSAEKCKLVSSDLKQMKSLKEAYQKSNK